MYRKFPKPPDAPCSGYLVITDEEADAEDTLCNTSCWGSCCGMCKRKSVKKLPFAQDKILTIVHTLDRYHETTTNNVWFIPVRISLSLPTATMSSEQKAGTKSKATKADLGYIAINLRKACRCSREGDIMAFCLRDFLRDKKPKPLNLRDAYQQVKIHCHHSGGFFTKSVAPDGLPPKFLKRKGWKVRCSSLNRL